MTEAPECTCSTWWIDPDTGYEYDRGGGDRERRWSRDPECPVHARTKPKTEESGE